MSRAGLDWLPGALADLADRDLLRVLTYCEGAPGPEVEIDGVPHLLLASNNYLGLAADPAVVEGARAALARYGAGAGASRLVTGSLDLHRRLEERLAALKRCEDALVFPTGFQANVGTIPALVGRGDAVFSDELNHASLIDGCRLSGAEVVRYPHADADALEAAVRAAGPRPRRLIATDTVFSMDGDLAPLPAIVAVAERHGCMLMVDEAHATGVLGATGAGALEHFGLEGRVPVVMGTLSKALGAQGGYVAGDRDLCAYLRTRDRGFVFTTALAPAAAGAALAALDIVRDQPERRAPPANAGRPPRGGRARPRLRGAAHRLGRGRRADRRGRRRARRGRVPAPRPGVGAGDPPALGAAGHRPPAPDGHGHPRGPPRQLGPRRPRLRPPPGGGLMIDEPGIFVMGTGTGVGKTVVTGAIALAARARGRDPAVLKPAQTGDDGTITGDAEFVAGLVGLDEPPEAICPYRLRAPLAPSVAAALEGRRLDPQVVARSYDDLSERHDLVLVEAAGGALVPFSDGVNMAGLASLLGLPVVVAARPGLGTLNHILLTLEALHRRGLTVLGVVISGYPAEPGLDALTNPPALARLNPVPLLGVIPHDPGIDVGSGAAGGLAESGPAALDPLLGGTFSPARFRRAGESRLAALTDHHERSPARGPH